MTVPAKTFPTKTVATRVGARAGANRKSISMDTIQSGGDPEQEYLLNKKTQSLNYLDVRILSVQQQHKLAALHYDAIHDYCFFFPSVLVTLLSGILAILTKSTLVPNDKTETVIALVIAILAILSTLIQSLMKQFDFSGRAGFHSSCASALRKLYMYSKLDAREATYNSIYQSLATTSAPVAVGTKLTEEKEHHDDGGSKGPKDKDTDSKAKSNKKSVVVKEGNADVTNQKKDYMDQKDT